MTTTTSMRTPQPRRRGRLRSAGALLAVVFPLPACGDEPVPPAHRGPVVLITIDTLRADTLGALGGEPGLTPHLDAFAADADWAAPAIATSSWTVPSMASIMTGLQPWRSGSWHAERARLSDDVTTLAEVLQAGGFRTHGFHSNTWLRQKFGHHRGFDLYHRLGGRRRATAVLGSLDGGAQFVWLHVLPPHAPYLRYDEFLERVGRADGDDLPERVTPEDLEVYFDPGVELPEDVRTRFWDMYRLNVAHSDRIVGELLDAIRASGHWDDALVVVTSDHGEEFGEAGQIAHGGNLDRSLLEVPLLIKLPEDGTDRALRPRDHVSNASIFATVVELTGVDAPPADGRLTSLLAPPVEGSGGALSELYLGNGVNTFSWLEDGRQILWRSRFGESSADYFRVRNAALVRADPALEARARELFSEQSSSFLTYPPLAGNGERPELHALTWGAGGGTLDATATNDDARRLRDAWTNRNGEDVPPAELGGESPVELTPREIEELRRMGYVVGG